MELNSYFGFNRHFQQLSSYFSKFNKNSKLHTHKPSVVFEFHREHTDSRGG